MSDLSSTKNPKSGWEFWGVWLATAVIALAGAGLYFGFSGSDEGRVGLGAEFGQVVYRKGELLRKLSGGFSFEPLKVGSVVFSGDEILTGEKSNAIIATQSGTTIELAESTLIRLESGSTFNLPLITKRSQVEVLAGQVQGQSYQPSLLGESGIVLKSSRDGREVKVQGEKQKSFKVDDQEALKKARPVPQPLPSPKATPSPSPTPSATRLMIPSSAGQISPQAVGSVKYLEPLDKAKIEISAGVGSEVAVLFRWSLNPAGIGAEFFLERVSTDSSSNLVRQTVLRTPVGGSSNRNELKLNLKLDGVYEWGIRRSGGLPFPGSRARSDFRIVRANPQAAAPIEIRSDGVVPQYDDLGTLQSIVVRWKGVSAQNQVILKFWDSPDVRRRPLFETKATGLQTQVDVRPIRSPRYFYRVDFISPRGTISSPLESWVARLSPPRVMRTQGNQIEFSLAGKQPLILEWSPVAFAESYQVQFASSAAFQGGSVQASKGTQLQLKGLKIGTYFFRIRTQSGSQFSVWSEPIELKIK